MFGPPVRRSETPCPYSWKIVSERKSASRIAGRAVLRCTRPVAGSPALMATPAACGTMIAGIVSAGLMEPVEDRRLGCRVVGEHDRGRPGGLRVRRLRVVVADARVVDERDRARRHRVRLTAVVHRCGPVVHEDDAAGDPGAGRVRREPRVVGRVRAGRPRRSVDRQRIRQPELEAGPEEHLHARAPAVVRGRGEVGVVRAGPVLGLAANVVAAHPAAAVVVDLEVARGLVEAVLVREVVDVVAPVEEVRDGRVHVVLGLVVDDVGEEVERQCRPAVGVTVRVQQVVGVAVRVRVDVVALRPS